MSIKPWNYFSHHCLASLLLWQCSSSIFAPTPISSFFALQPWNSMLVRENFFQPQMCHSVDILKYEAIFTSHTCKDWKTRLSRWALQLLCYISCLTCSLLQLDAELTFPSSIWTNDCSGLYHMSIYITYSRELHLIWPAVSVASIHSPEDQRRRYQIKLLKYILSWYEIRKTCVCLVVTQQASYSSWLELIQYCVHISSFKAKQPLNKHTDNVMRHFYRALEESVSKHNLLSTITIKQTPQIKAKYACESTKQESNSRGKWKFFKPSRNHIFAINIRHSSTVTSQHFVTETRNHRQPQKWIRRKTDFQQL